MIQRKLWKPNINNISYCSFLPQHDFEPQSFFEACLMTRAVWKPGLGRVPAILCPNGANCQPTSWRVRLATSRDPHNSSILGSNSQSRSPPQVPSCYNRPISNKLDPIFPCVWIFETAHPRWLDALIISDLYQELHIQCIVYTPAGSHCGFDRHAMIRGGGRLSNFSVFFLSHRNPDINDRWQRLSSMLYVVGLSSQYQRFVGFFCVAFGAVSDCNKTQTVS